MMIFLIWLAVLAAALVFYLKQHYSIFERKGVKGPKPIWFLGTGMNVCQGKEHMADYIDRLYKTYPNERFIGHFEFWKPMLVIRDIDLVKRITTKDFDHFRDHRIIVDSHDDPLFARNLVTLKGQEWKDMRSMLTPAFTSSKIRLMAPLMLDVSNQMNKILKQQIKESNEDCIDVDVHDLTTRYANDVFATCAFGLNVDSMAVRDNEFYKMGKIVTHFDFTKLLKVFFFFFMPIVVKVLKFKLISESVSSFFKGIILQTMEERKKNNIYRPDMIHLMMQANKDWSEDDLVAQAILLLLGGFDTASASMAFALHELAMNPDVQDKLVKEIKENEARNGGEFDFKTIQELPYMDMVVSEVLRIWTPGSLLDRMCSKDYNIGRPNDEATQDYIVRKGEVVQIAMWAIHRDPEHFPDPMKFDPQRFSEENKHKIKPFTYMPFGTGPRNCIASRFALCELKVMLYQLLLHFEVLPSQKSTLKRELITDTIKFRFKDGDWVRMRLRH